MNEACLSIARDPLCSGWLAQRGLVGLSSSYIFSYKQTDEAQEEKPLEPETPTFKKRESSFRDLDETGNNERH